MTDLKLLRETLAATKAAIAQVAPDGNYCRKCGATDVYWMTVMPKAEAEIARLNNLPAALKLGKPRLFNLSGGEHVCALSDDDFGVVP